MKPFCTIAAIGLSLIALAGAYSQPYSGPGSGSGYGRDYTGPGSGTGMGRDYTGPGSGTGMGDAARSSREAGVMVSA
jgi:hypothetical protein